MTAFSEQLNALTPGDKTTMKQSQIDQAWELMGGKNKGFITIAEYHNLVKQCLPKCFDADLALELFREVDSDKDGKLSYKDFNDCIKF